MSDATYNCVKCGGEMVRGFLADKGEHVQVFGANWYDGDPVNSSLFGIKGSNLKIDYSQPEKKIRGMRCGNCGYLELYAVPAI